MSNVEARIQDILNHTSPQVRPQYLLSDIKEAVEVIERLRCILDEEEAKHNLLNAAIQDIAARIAEMEAAIYQYVNHVVSYEGISFIDEINEPPWAKLINDTWVKQAALEGGKE